MKSRENLDYNTLYFKPWHYNVSTQYISIVKTRLGQSDSYAI